MNWLALIGAAILVLAVAIWAVFRAARQNSRSPHFSTLACHDGRHRRLHWLAPSIVGAAACSAPKRCRSFENWLNR